MPASIVTENTPSTNDIYQRFFNYTLKLLRRHWLKFIRCVKLSIKARYTNIPILAAINGLTNIK